MAGTPRPAEVLRDEISGELISHEHEARAHDGDIGRISVTHEAARRPPCVERDQYQAQGQKLPDLDPDVERDHIVKKRSACLSTLVIS